MAKRDAAAAECDEIEPKRAVTALVAGPLVWRVESTSREMRRFLTEMYAAGCVEMRAEDHAVLRARAAGIVAMLDDPSRTRIATVIDWAQLPRDCWRLIVGEVANDRATMAAVRGTCRRFRELANELAPAVVVRVDDFITLKQLPGSTVVAPIHNATVALTARFALFSGATRLVFALGCPPSAKGVSCEFDVRGMVQPVWDLFRRWRTNVTPGKLTLQFDTPKAATGKSYQISRWELGKLELADQRLVISYHQSKFYVGAAFNAHSIRCGMLLGGCYSNPLDTIQRTDNAPLELIVIGSRLAGEPTLVYCADLLARGTTVYQRLRELRGPMACPAIGLVAEYVHYEVDMALTPGTRIEWLRRLFWSEAQWTSVTAPRCEVHLWIGSAINAEKMYKALYQMMSTSSAASMLPAVSFHIHTGESKTPIKKRLGVDGLTIDRAYWLCYSCTGIKLFHTPRLSQSIITRWLAAQNPLPAAD